MPGLGIDIVQAKTFQNRVRKADGEDFVCHVRYPLVESTER
jgi:hypothetical protein